MFKALLRRIAEAVWGTIENEQELTDLSIRIPVGYLVACRRAHGQRKRHTPKRRRQRKVKAENTGLKQKLADTEADHSKELISTTTEIKELKEELEATKAERDQERAARVAAETNIQELQAKNSSLAKTWLTCPRNLEEKQGFHILNSDRTQSMTM